MKGELHLGQVHPWDLLRKPQTCRTRALQSQIEHSVSANDKTRPAPAGWLLCRMRYKPLRQVGIERKAYRRMHTPHHRLQHHCGRCLRRDTSDTHRIHLRLQYVAGGAREPDHLKELGCIVQPRATHLCRTSRSRSYRAGHTHSV